MTSHPPPAVPLTKPVRRAGQRPTPRWVGWFLILLPTLAALGPLLGGERFSAFRIAIVVLFITAAWDWWRFQDRSRTFYATLALAVATMAAGGIAFGWSRPPVDPALAELAAVALLFALGLAFVQLYRTSETVLTVARGTLYMLVLVVIEGVWEILSGRRLPTFHLPPEARGTDPAWNLIAGPFGEPKQLAAACCAALLVMPVGFALEHDRRLKWAYVAVTLPVPLIVLHTGSTLGLLVCLAILVLWSLLHRLTRFVVAPLVLVWLVLHPRGIAFFANVWGELTGPWLSPVPDRWWASQERFNLMLDGVVMLRRSLWLGVGPGGFPYVMQTQSFPFPTNGVIEPHSAMVEIVAQYGLSIFIALTLAVIGVMRWCVQRLLSTRGQALMSSDRVVAFWLLVTLALWPATSMLAPTWLAAPMSALQVATIVMWARHIERPRGRLVMPSETALRHIPPGPGAPPPTSADTR